MKQYSKEEFDKLFKAVKLPFHNPYAPTQERLNEDLYKACSQNKSLEEIRGLVEKGADVKARDNNSGWTALHAATRTGNIEIIDYLVNTAKADVNSTDKFDETPLHIAICMGNAQLVKYLVGELHANIYAKNKRGYGALELANHELKSVSSGGYDAEKRRANYSDIIEYLTEVSKKPDVSGPSTKLENPKNNEQDREKEI